VHVATTVDDYFCTVKAKEDFMRVCREAFEERTVEEGDSLNIIEMHLEFDIVKRVVKITSRLGVA
jgi:hypothetical protein